MSSLFPAFNCFTQSFLFLGLPQDLGITSLGRSARKELSDRLNVFRGHRITINLIDLSNLPIIDDSGVSSINLSDPLPTSADMISDHVRSINANVNAYSCTLVVCLFTEQTSLYTLGIISACRAQYMQIFLGLHASKINSLISQGLRSLDFYSVTRLVRTSGELVFSHRVAPGDGVTGSYTNMMRHNCLLFMKAYCNINSVAILGWDLFTFINAFRANLRPIVIEKSRIIPSDDFGVMKFTAKPHHDQFDENGMFYDSVISSKIRNQIGKQIHKFAHPEGDYKLAVIGAYALNYIMCLPTRHNAKYIIYIGAYPGKFFIDSRLFCLRMGINIILIDPAFPKNEHYSNDLNGTAFTIIRAAWDYRRKYVENVANISKVYPGIMPAVSSDLTDVLFIDDVWIETGMRDLLHDKLAFFEGLPPRSKAVVKFNFYGDFDDSITIRNVVDHFFVPFTGDSNESRIVLSGSYADKSTVYAPVYHALCNKWRAMSSWSQRWHMANQFISSIYEADFILNPTIISHHLEYDGIDPSSTGLLSLYSLTNVSNGSSPSNLINLAESAVRKIGFPIILTDFIVYERVVTYLSICKSKTLHLKNNMVLSTHTPNTNYNDYCTPMSVIIDKGFYELPDYMIYNLTMTHFQETDILYSVPPYGYRTVTYNGGVNTLFDNFMWMRQLRAFAVKYYGPQSNWSFKHATIIQNADTILGFRVKWITMIAGAIGNLGGDESYSLRAHLVQILVVKDLRYRSYLDEGVLEFGNDEHAVIINKRKDGKSITLSFKVSWSRTPQQISFPPGMHSVSGHLLNILLCYPILSVGIKLWLEQVKYNNAVYSGRNQSMDPIKKIMRLQYQRGWIVETATADYGKVWHTNIEFLLALYIAPDYMQTMYKKIDVPFAKLNEGFNNLCAKLIPYFT